MVPLLSSRLMIAGLVLCAVGWIAYGQSEPEGLGGMTFLEGLGGLLWVVGLLTLAVGLCGMVARIVSRSRQR